MKTTLMNFKQIGKIVTQSRVNKKMTQEEAANACDISLRNYAGVEHGEGKASIKTLNKVSKNLDVPFDLSFPLK